MIWSNGALDFKQWKGEVAERSSENDPCKNYLVLSKLLPLKSSQYTKWPKENCTKGFISLSYNTCTTQS